MSEGQTPERFRQSGVLHSFNESVSASKDLVRAEFRLARLEAKQGLRSLGQHAASIGAFALLAFLGVCSLVAALVIGLAELIFGMNYWLSALVVGSLFIAVAGIAVAATIKRIRSQDLSLPHFRRSLSNERTSVSSKLREVVDATPRFRRRDAA
jgi:hypothetical protein